MRSVPLVDPRGARFAAWLTSAMLVAVLATGSGWLALAQAAVFGLGAINLRYAPYALIYRNLVAPRRAAPPRAELEPAGPVRFAQGVGFAFAALAATGYLVGWPVLGAAAAAGALAAAFANAAFGFCLACHAYPFLRLAAHRLGLR